MSYALQGLALEFGKCVDNGKGIFYFRPGCFDTISDVRLLINHEGKGLATTSDRLEVYAGDDALAFRFYLPDSWNDSFDDLADDVDSYIPISLGFSSTKYESIKIDGIEVKVISQGTLNEISLLNETPATKSSYGRFVSVDDCGTLEQDYELGRLQLIGRYIAVHRALKARENGGPMKYAHISTSYDRAASRFTRALQALV